MLIAHLYLLPTVRMRAPMRIISLYAFMVWTGKTSPFSFIFSLRFQIFTAVTDQMMGFFWVSPPFGGWMFWHSGGIYCLHLWSDWISSSGCWGDKRGRNLSVIEDGLKVFGQSQLLKVTWGYWIVSNQWKLRLEKDFHKNSPFLGFISGICGKNVGGDCGAISACC